MSTSSRTSPQARRRGGARTASDDAAPGGVAGFFKRRLRELGAALPGALALGLLLAFVTYNPDDPSPNVASDGPISNVLGAPGAAAADIVLRSLGLAGFALVAILLGWSLRMLRDGAGLPRGWLRMAATPPALLLLAAAFAALPTPESWTLQAGLGGFAGLLGLRWLTDLTGLGATLAAAFCAVLGVVLAHYAAALTRTEWRGVRRAFAWLGGGAGALAGSVRRETPDEAEAQAATPRARKRGRDKDKAEAGRKRRREPSLLPGGAAQAEDDEDAAVEAPEPPRRPTEVTNKAPKARPGRKAQGADQQRFPFDGSGGYEPPSLSLLSRVESQDRGGPSRDALEKNARLLETVLQDFGVKGEIVKVRPGPVVTRYELEPAPGTKTSRVIGLADDIARSMSAVSVRVAVVPGSSVIGIELPNKQREKVVLRELLASETYEKDGGTLPLTLGKDISGHPTIVDLTRMPHLLIAGTTGSGKSVAVNAMLLSLLYRLPPERCRMILIDPKMLELSVYDDIPHLLTPVVTDPKKAVVALKWTVREMEDRYRAMSKLGVRNIAGYNERIEEARKNGEVLTRKVQTGFDPDTGNPIHEEQPFDLQPLPHIVVVVDEMADLMLVAGKEIEMTVQRLAQMARAAGIHVIMATQRPSVDVITGTIKANFPTRISFHVTSKIDSRTILGETGAEQLLGQGDMLYMAHGGRITRVHGPFVADSEVEGVVKHLRTQGQPDYIESVTQEDEDSGNLGDILSGGGGDGDLYQKAVQVVVQHKKASTSFVQRQLQIGYNRAARLIERMETEGVVSSANHVGKREILIDQGDH